MKGNEALAPSFGGSVSAVFLYPLAMDMNLAPFETYVLFGKSHDLPQSHSALKSEAEGEMVRRL